MQIFSYKIINISSRTCCDICIYDLICSHKKNLLCTLLPWFSGCQCINDHICINQNFHLFCTKPLLLCFIHIRIYGKNPKQGFCGFHPVLIWIGQFSYHFPIFCDQNILGCRQQQVFAKIFFNSVVVTDIKLLLSLHYLKYSTPDSNNFISCSP